MKALRVFVVLTASALVLISQAACPKERFPSGFTVTSRPSALTLTSGGDFTLDASCQPGEQLLGGAYGLPANNLGRLTATATFPLSDNTWRVRVHREANTQISDDVVAVAYCMAAPFDAILSTVTVDVTSPGNLLFDGIVPCPVGSTVTGGGYETDANQTSYNALVMASAPFIDATGIARGWLVGVASPGTPLPKMTAFVRCSGAKLTGAQAVVTSLTAPLPTSSPGPFELEARCPDTAFTTGGGYSLVDNGLMPRAISVSQARGQFALWHLESQLGALPPTASTPARTCNRFLNPDCTDTVAALCINVPSVP